MRSRHSAGSIVECRTQETFHIARSSNVVQKGRTLLYFRLDS